MTISYTSVGSVLNEQPPAGHRRSGNGQPEHPQARAAIDEMTPPPRRAEPPSRLSAPAAAPPSTRPTTTSLLEPPERPAPKTNAKGSSEIGDFEVVYDDAQGYPLLAFADGHWFDVTSNSPRPVSVRYALRRDPAWAGAVVQTSCLWMRGHPHDERSFDLATELSLAVGELIRQP